MGKVEDGSHSVTREAQSRWSKMRRAGRELLKFVHGECRYSFLTTLLVLGEDLERVLHCQAQITEFFRNLY